MIPQYRAFFGYRGGLFLARRVFARGSFGRWILQWQDRAGFLRRGCNRWLVVGRGYLDAGASRQDFHRWANHGGRPDLGSGRDHGSATRKRHDDRAHSQQRKANADRNGKAQ